MSQVVSFSYLKKILSPSLKYLLKDIILNIIDLPKSFKNFHYTEELGLDFVDMDLTRPTVIMCTWRRVNRLPKTLQMLENQTVKPNLLIWNNNHEERGLVDEYLKNSTIDSRVFHSVKNIGGFGRFYLAKDVAKVGIKKVIFIDDDQIINTHYIENLLDEHASQTTHSGWAFQINNWRDYWDRKEVMPHEEVDYAATNGMIIDTNIFINDPELFECPARFWFIEDLWLTFIAKKNDYKAYKSIEQTQTNFDGKDQVGNWKMAHRKRVMLRYLIKQRGYKLIKDS